MSTLTDEQEIFAAALAPDEPQEVPAPQREAEQPLEEPAEPAEPAEPSEPGSEEPGDPRQPRGQPSAEHRDRREREELRAERERTRALEEQLARLVQTLQPQPQPQPKAEEPPPDMFAEPDKWGKHLVEPLVQPLQDQLVAQRQFYSHRFAVQAHGPEKVDEAYKALNEAVDRGELSRDGVEAALRGSMDPAGEIIGWHRKRRALTEIGDDPEAYRQRVRQEIEAELRGPAPTPQPAPPPAAAGRPGAPSLPSLNRAFGNAGSPQSAVISEEDIFNSAPTFGRRKA